MVNTEEYIDGMTTLIAWYKDAMVLCLSLTRYKNITNKKCPLCIVASSKCVENSCPWIVMTNSPCYATPHPAMNKSDTESILNRIFQLELWIGVYNENRY